MWNVQPSTNRHRFDIFATILKVEANIVETAVTWIQSLARYRAFVPAPARETDTLGIF
jgi:hypothetical protein